MGEHAGEDGFLRDTAIADDPDGFDGLRTLGDGKAGSEYEDEGEREPRDESRNPEIAGNGIVLEDPAAKQSVGSSYLHRAGVLRRAQILVRSKVRLHGKNMHTLTA